MTNNFEDWSYEQLFYLFTMGCVTELIQKQKLSHTAMLSFPALSGDGWDMYKELKESMWFPDEDDVPHFIHYLRVIGDRDVADSKIMLH